MGDPEDFSVGQVVTVFRSRLRGGSDVEYAEMSRDMEAAARASTGFVDYAEFAATDGERVAVATFATREAHDAWRDDVRH